MGCLLGVLLGAWSGRWFTNMYAGYFRLPVLRALVFKNSGEFFPRRVSGDQRWLALQKARSNADSDI